MNQGNYANAVPVDDPYGAHQRAAAEWAQACRSYAEASQAKEMAAKRLAETTQRLGEILQASQLDPTIPQPAERPYNGLAGMQSQLR